MTLFDWLWIAFLWLVLMCVPERWLRRRPATRPFVPQSEAATRRLVEGLRPRRERGR